MYHCQFLLLICLFIVVGFKKKRLLLPFYPAYNFIICHKQAILPLVSLRPTPIKAHFLLICQVMEDY